jgi:hypothetical protein
MRTLLEARNRHRGKGQQKMAVEHVHLHSGGRRPLECSDGEWLLPDARRTIAGGAEG